MCILGLYEQVTNLKALNPTLKIILSVGGYNHGSEPFRKMWSNNENRKKFVISVLKYLNLYDFDGLELNWHPGSEDAKNLSDIEHLKNKYFFTKLCEVAHSFEKIHFFLFIYVKYFQLN